MNQQELLRIFGRFQEQRVLIIGDVMVDSYLWGKVDRISPEAPVPVVAVQRREQRLGGAANVALNVKALGAHSVLASIIGKDRDGDLLLELLKQEGLSQEGIVRLNRPTTVKTRIIGNQHQLLRVDEEDDSSLKSEDTTSFISHITRLLNSSSFDVIIFEDYDKGLISETLIQSVVALAKEKKILIAVDPKKRNFLSYQGVDLFKPNLKEIKEGLKIEVDPRSSTSLAAADAHLREVLSHTWSLITLSENGMFASNGQEVIQVPSRPVIISDVSGAGDTVISMAALCLAAGADIQMSTFLANLAGGSVCEKPGVVPMNAASLLAEATLELKKLPDL
jgi:rfaE bifunctional protein kinase chain/domain